MQHTFLTQSFSPLSGWNSFKEEFQVTVLDWLLRKFRSYNTKLGNALTKYLQNYLIQK